MRCQNHTVELPPTLLNPTKHFTELKDQREVFGRLVQCRMAGHAYTGEFHKQFFPQKSVSCDCGETFQTREDIIRGCTWYENHLASLRDKHRELTLPELLGTPKGIAALATFIKDSRHSHLREKSIYPEVDWFRRRLSRKDSRGNVSEPALQTPFCTHEILSRKRGFGWLGSLQVFPRTTPNWYTVIHSFNILRLEVLTTQKSDRQLRVFIAVHLPYCLRYQPIYQVYYDMHSKIFSNGLRSLPFLRGQVYSNLILSCWAYAPLQFGRLEPNAHSLSTPRTPRIYCSAAIPPPDGEPFRHFPLVICTRTWYFTARTYASSPPCGKYSSSSSVIGGDARNGRLIHSLHDSTRIAIVASSDILPNCDINCRRKWTKALFLNPSENFLSSLPTLNLLVHLNSFYLPWIEQCFQTWLVQWLSFLRKCCSFADFIMLPVSSPSAILLRSLIMRGSRTTISRRCM